MCSCPTCGELGHVGTSCPTATALTHPLTLPEWATLEDFELVSQDYDGGNVTVDESPTSFFPFSLVDCTLLSHFSFNDFVAIAFLDLAEDLDIQI